MGSIGFDNQPNNNDFCVPTACCCNLQKFRLYETRSNFYMIGRDKSRICWKILKINRLEQSELSLSEDPTLYSEIECSELLKRLHDGNKSTGGLKFVSTCYGIVGFIKFLGPYYMLLITKRRKIGTICGHAVYAVAKSEMISIPHSTVKSNLAYSKNENRYKKLLRSMDLTKDFYFSYSYRVMLSLQKNLSNHQTGMKLYDTMFVWNEFLTRGIRNQLKNSAWTVALVYGFFKQVTLSISGREFHLILIARRSRHYAGTRYLKRGVNDIGRVANDVETEQIVLEDAPEGFPVHISSVVQVRGSIPLFWSQESSRLNIKPDIILSNKDETYEATKLHFQNLVKRYGNPIIILNLIKTREKKPRESILRKEFANAIEIINKDLAYERQLKYLHWDLNRYSRSKSGSVLAYLVKVAANALNLTGFFYCRLPPPSSKLPCTSSCNSQSTDKEIYNMALLADLNVNDNIIDKDDMEGSQFSKPMLLQKGVLRTNCIDCLDRTNVAQYTYGLVALGHQLHALGYIGVSSISLDSPLADDLMKAYEAMGDILALQYGGSTAHNKIFSERRGQWKAATQSQELIRNFQRFYSNACMDAEKQAAINMFLGHFQPQQGRPALWELDSDQHYTGARGSDFSEEKERPMLKRSLSDGNVPCDSSNSNIDDAARAIQQMGSIHKPLPAKIPERCSVELSESTSQISTFDTSSSYSRYTPSISSSLLLSNMQPDQYLAKDSISLAERGDSFDCSNFLVSELSSSGNSCEDDTYERSLLIPSPDAGLSSKEIRQQHSAASMSGLSLKGKEVAYVDLGCDAASSSNNLSEYSEQFVNWVTEENGLWH